MWIVLTVLKLSGGRAEDPNPYGHQRGSRAVQWIRITWSDLPGADPFVPCDPFRFAYDVLTNTPCGQPDLKLG